ncbi:MAG: hypothetical protein ACLFP2_01085 [Candidatus Woesearchaeota archaeon]
MKKPIASFMIMLILTLPFYISSTFAAYSIDVDSASGADGYYDSSSSKGYMTRPDDLTFEITATDTDSGVNDSRIFVRMGSGGYHQLPPGSCGSGTTASCTYTIDGFTLYASETFEFKIVDSSEVYKTSDSVTVVPDFTDPRIDDFSVTPSTSNDGEFEFDVSATDSAYTGTTDCVGLSRVKIYENESNVLDHEVSTPSCTVDLDLNHSSDIQSGVYDYCVQAWDRFGQNSSRECKSVVVDRLPPSLVSMNITQNNKDPLEYVGNNPYPARMAVVFEPEDIDYAEADVSGFASEDEVTSSSCSASDGKTTCLFDIHIDINSSITPEAEITVYDDFGNSETGTLSSSTILMDTSGPEFTWLRTNHSQLVDGTYLFTSNNKIKLKLNEREFEDEAYLDLSAIGGGDNVKAEKCNSTGTNQYTCYWGADGVESDGQYPISTVYAEDVLENPNQNNLTVNLTVDTASPFIHDISVNKTDDSDSQYEDYIVKGSNLDVEVVVEDPGNLVTMEGDFSEFNNNSEVGFNCRQNGTYRFLCEGQSGRITTDDLGNLNFVVTAYDEVGNEFSQQKEVYITGLDNETNYWESSVRCSPNPVDREITSIREIRSICSVNLSSDANASVVEIAKEDCFSSNNQTNGTSSMDYVAGQPEFWNNMFEITLRATSMDDVDSLDITCPLSIFTEIQRGEDTYISETPEIENVSISLGFYNLDKYSDAQRDKLEDIKDKTEEWWTTIAELEGIIEYAEMYCNIINTLESISSGIAALGTAFAWYEPISEPLMSTHKKVDGFADTLSGLGFNFCCYVSCECNLMDKVPGLGELSKGLQGWSNDNAEDYSLGDLARDLGDNDDEDSDGEDGDSDGGDGNVVFNTPESFKQGQDVVEGGMESITGRGSDDETKSNNDANNGEGSSSEQEGGSTGGNAGLSGADKKDSLILSLVFLCIPGIVQKTKELRDMYCYKGSCYIQSMKVNVPQSACDEQFDYMTCNFIVGETMSIVMLIFPWGGILKQIMQEIKDMLTDPFSLLFGGYELFVCQYMGTSSYWACGFPKAIGTLLVTIDQVTQMFESLGEMGDETYDACDTFETELEEVGL